MTLDKLLSWAGVLGAQQLYLPAPHGKQQGSICHDEKVAYRPFIQNDGSWTHMDKGFVLQYPCGTYR